MRILYLNPDGDLGGAQRSLLDLMAGVRGEDSTVEMHVIAGAPGPFVSRAESTGARAVVLPMPPSLTAFGESDVKYGGRLKGALSLAAAAPGACSAAYRYAGALRKEIQSVRPSLVHTNALKCHVLAARAIARGTPLLWHVRDLLGTRSVVNHALRWTASRATGILAISKAVARDARRTLPRLPVHVLYNAVDTGHFSPGPGDGDRLDALAGLRQAPASTVRVGLVATYSVWKGHDIFLQACARLIAAQPSTPARFHIIGGPIYRTRGSQHTEEGLRRRAHELGLEGRVGFVPFQEDPAPFYRALDVVVHASTEPEPFGRTIVEAMSCGRAVIVSAAGGAAELFTEGRDAVGFPPGDVGALAGAIRTLVQDADMRRMLGEVGRATAVKRFSLPRLGREALAIYRQVLGLTGP